MIQNKITQTIRKTVAVAALSFCTAIVLAVGVIAPSSASAMSRGVGERLVGEYGTACKNYELRKHDDKKKQDRRCLAVYAALKDGAGCDFGLFKAGIKLFDCINKVKALPVNPIRKADGERLITEYDKDCKDYDFTKHNNNNQQDVRCAQVATSLAEGAGCEFGAGGFDGARKIVECAEKVSRLSASGGSGSSSTGGSGGGSTDTSEVAAVNDPALDCIKNPNRCNLMKKYVNPIITFLTAFVGIAVTIGIISGGIRMASAADDSSKLAAGKKQISTAIVALLAMMILYAAINWLAPALRS